MKINRTGILCGAAAATIHFIAVALLYHAIVVDNSRDAVYGWILLLFIDFPVSLGMGIRSLQIEGDYIWNNGTLPGLYFGILGTLWWFMLGYIICTVITWSLGKLRGKRTGAERLNG